MHAQVIYTLNSNMSQRTLIYIGTDIQYHIFICTNMTLYLYVLSVAYLCVVPAKDTPARRIRNTQYMSMLKNIHIYTYVMSTHLNVLIHTPSD